MLFIKNVTAFIILFLDIPLRLYQLAGVNWLIDCYKKEHGAILGDEMGLGKTCQVNFDSTVIL